MKKTKSEYGSWISDINSKALVEDQINLRGKQIIPLQDGNFFWICGKPTEQGRNSILKKEGEKIMDLIPEPFNARTRVHEYGGSCVCSTSDGKTIFFTNFKDQHLYSVETDSQKEPKLIFSQNGLRFADLTLDENRNCIFCVVEDHSDTLPPYPSNYIASISLNDFKFNILTSGSDFYSNPRISKNGNKISWIEWKFPNMPWDETELFVASLNVEGSKISDKQLITTGNDVSISQSEFSPFDDSLFFISDESGFANIGMFKDEKITFLKHDMVNADFSKPCWTFGTKTFAILDSKRILASYGIKGEGKLSIFDLETSKKFDCQLPFSNLNQIHLLSNTKENEFKVVLLAGSFDTPWSVVTLDLKIKENGVNITYEIIQQEIKNKIDPEYLSTPESIEFPTIFNGKETTAFGFYYPPKNAKYEGLDGSKPPLLCKLHGGPTANVSLVFNLSIQYWTSHGFAVMDLNYGGSTGFGKEYQNRLRKQWGIVDVNDCVAAVNYCVKEKGIDPEKVCIDGESAGGFSTLACLAFTKTFKAGASLYGVSDLEALALDTHKFEAHYLDLLVDIYDPKSENKIYRERSPIHHCDKIDSPIILLQGLEDKIVLPNQAEMFYKAVKAKGLPVSLILFEGEQHGFRISENVRKAYDSELYFYSKVFKFQLNEPDIEPIPIDNLKE
jgi:dienelactone hydrolase